MPLDNCSICSARLKIMSLLLESCLSTSFTHSLRPIFCGSPMSLAGTIHGPSGHEPSKVLCLVQPDLNRWGSLVLGPRPALAPRGSVAVVLPVPVCGVFLRRRVLGGASDPRRKLHLPVHLVGDAGNLYRRAGVGERPRPLDEMPRFEALAM